MSQLQEFLSKIQLRLVTTLRKVEESSLFERIVQRYESLDPRYQSRVSTAGKALFLILLLYLSVGPLISVAFQKINNSRLDSLLSEIQSFNGENLIERVPAPKPSGWQNLPSNTADDLENSLQQYFANLGIISDNVSLTRSENTFTLKISDFSLRQAVSILFQLDGWQPAIRTTKMKLSVNPNNKVTVDFESSFEFDPAAAQRFAELPQDGGFDRGSDSGGSAAPLPSDAPTQRIGRPPGFPANGGPFPPPSGLPSDMSNFENSFPPPPSEDFNADLPPPAFEDEL